MHRVASIILGVYTPIGIDTKGRVNFFGGLDLPKN